MVVVLMVINVILATILKFANNLWETNVPKAIIANLDTFIKVVLTTTWDSALWVNHAKINTLSENCAGTIWMDIAKKEVNALIIIPKYSLRKISKNPSFCTNIYSSTNLPITFVIIVLRSDIKLQNVPREWKLKSKTSSNVVYVEILTI